MLISLGCGLLAAGEAQQVKWSDLATRVTNRRVALILPVGAEIEGKAVGVEPGGLRLRVSKTSDRKVAAKGEQLIPRTSVTVIRVTQYRIMGRLICTAGMLGLASAFFATRDVEDQEGPVRVALPAAAATVSVGAGVAGYFIGKRIDKKVIYLRVVPE